MWSVCVYVCLHVCVSVKNVLSVRLSLPNTSDQRVYTQASLCCHTGINRVWGCVNHSKPQKTHTHTYTHTCTHTSACQAAIPCSCVWRAKQWRTNLWTGETEQWTMENRHFWEELRWNKSQSNILNFTWEPPIVPVISSILTGAVGDYIQIVLGPTLTNAKCQTFPGHSFSTVKNRCFFHFCVIVY